MSVNLPEYRFRKASTLLLIMFLLISLSACDHDSGGNIAPISGTPTSSNVDTDYFSVYFSQPDNPASKSYRGGPDAYLADAIENARLSVDIAVLNLNLWSIRDALIAAHRRGVQVRMVTDSDYSDGTEIKALREAGIPVLGDRRESLMHHKFVIIDRQQIWTGSMNLTINGAYRNDNNLIRIQDEQLAQDYLVEFDEMFVDDRFGDASRADTPFPEITIGGYPVEIRFSPDDGVENLLVSLIENAEERVDVLAYAFTLDSLADALIQTEKQGVAVHGVFDKGQVSTNRGGEYQRLVDSGLDIRLDGNPDSMHHKVLIIDGNIIVVGSYNFSSSAENKNDENVLILHDPAIAAYFVDEFERIFEQSLD